MLIWTFDQLSIDIDGHRHGSFGGNAEIDVDTDGDLEPYVARISLEDCDVPRGQRAEPLVLHRPRPAAPDTFRDGLFEKLEERILALAADDVRNHFAAEYAAFARRELGYGHLQRELI